MISIPEYLRLGRLTTFRCFSLHSLKRITCHETHAGIRKQIFVFLNGHHVKLNSITTGMTSVIVYDPASSGRWYSLLGAAGRWLLLTPRWVWSCGRCLPVIQSCLFKHTQGSVAAVQPTFFLIFPPDSSNLLSLCHVCRALCHPVDQQQGDVKLGRKYNMASGNWSSCS